MGGPPAVATARRPPADRWLMWGLPTFLFLIAFLHRAVPGVFAKELMQAFGVTGAVVGHLSVTYFYAYAGLMLPAGLLVDTVGVRGVVPVGGLVMGGGTLTMALAVTPGPLFTGRLLVGAGAAVMFVGALKIAATWFPASYFGTLSAVTGAVGVLGGLIGTAPLAGLAALAGWRGALGIVGLVTVTAAGLCAWLVRDHPDAPSVGGTRPAPTLPAMLDGLRQVLVNVHTWPPFLAFLFLVSAFQDFGLWVVPYLRDVYGLSLTRAALYATAAPLALLVSGPLTGFASDRVLRRRKLPYTVLTAGYFACLAIFVATLGRLSLGGVAALFFAMGFLSGAFVLTWPIGREVNPPHLAGLAVAAVNLGGFVGVALTQGPLGAALDARWMGAMADGARVYPVEAYRATFGACAGFTLAASLMTLLLRETRGRNVYRAGTRRS